MQAIQAAVIPCEFELTIQAAAVGITRPITTLLGPVEPYNICVNWASVAVAESTLRRVTASVPSQTRPVARSIGLPFVASPHPEEKANRPPPVAMFRKNVLIRLH